MLQNLLLCAVIYLGCVPLVVAKADLREQMVVDAHAAREIAKYSTVFRMIPARVAQMLQVVNAYPSGNSALRAEILQLMIQRMHENYRLVQQLQERVQEVQEEAMPQSQTGVFVQGQELLKSIKRYQITLISTLSVLDAEFVRCVKNSRDAGEGKGRRDTAYLAARAAILPNKMDRVITLFASNASEVMPEGASQSIKGEIRHLRNQVSALSAHVQSKALLGAQEVAGRDFGQQVAELQKSHLKAVVQEPRELKEEIEKRAVVQRSVASSELLSDDLLPRMSNEAGLVVRIRETAEDWAEAARQSMTTAWASVVEWANQMWKKGEKPAQEPKKDEKKIAMVPATEGEAPLPLRERVQLAAAGAWQNFKEALARFWGAILNSSTLISAAYHNIADFFGRIFGDTQKAAEHVGSRLKEVKDVTPEGVDAAKEAVCSFGTWIVDSWMRIGAFFLGLWEPVTQGWAWLQGECSAADDYMRAMACNVCETISTTVRRLNIQAKAYMADSLNVVRSRFFREPLAEGEALSKQALDTVDCPSAQEPAQPQSLQERIVGFFDRSIAWTRASAQRTWEFTAQKIERFKSWLTGLFLSAKAATVAVARQEMGT